MKISDILRQVADAMDTQMNQGQPDDQFQNPAELNTVDTGIAVDVPNNTDYGSDNAVMIPPQQVEFELLKRAAGLINPVEDTECADTTLDQLRKNAGIHTSSPVIAQY